eukprot:83546-Rhodomonas_salina.1
MWPASRAVLGLSDCCELRFVLLRLEEGGIRLGTYAGAERGTIVGVAHPIQPSSSEFVNLPKCSCCGIGSGELKGGISFCWCQVLTIVPLGIATVIQSFVTPGLLRLSSSTPSSRSHPKVTLRVPASLDSRRRADPLVGETRPLMGRHVALLLREVMPLCELRVCA